MKTSTKPIAVLVVGFTILVGSAVLFGLPQVRRAAQIGAAGRARLQMEQWARAAEAYHEAHGALPAGDSDAVLETLRADPASRQAFSDLGPAERGGPLVDSWGTPWRVVDGSGIEVRSAGPNRRFGDEDDLSSLSLKAK